MAKRSRSDYERDGFKLGTRGKGWVVDCRGQSDWRGPKRLKLDARWGDEKAARTALDQWIEAYHVLKKHQQAVTVGELWDWWTKERTQDGFKNDIYMAQWVSLAPHFAARPAEGLSAQDFRDYARQRFEIGRAAWTVHTEISRLISCLKRATKARKIAFLPETWNCSQGKHRDRVLTMEEARRLLEAAQEGDPHVALFIHIAFASGARHKAILDLSWQRIDWLAGTIQFDEQRIRDPMSKSWTKGRPLVPMNKAVRAALEQAYAGRQSDWVIEHGGRRLKSIREGFAAAVRRAGLVEITPHTIRHTVASWLEDRVGDARRAQLLGHGNIETTRKVYTHSGAELLEEAVSYLDFAPEQPNPS